MATKFKLTAEPTFKLKVDIPIQGAGPEKVEFTFRHRTADQLDEWMLSQPGRPGVDCLMDILVGWELSDEFNRENVNRMHQQFPACWAAIQSAYLEEMAGIRRKN